MQVDIFLAFKEGLAFALPGFTGSEPSAACSRLSEGSEWQRSARFKPALSGAESAGHLNRTGQKKPPTFVGGLMFALPIFTARAIYRPAVRGCPVDIHRQKKAPTFQSRLCVRVTYFHGQSPGNYRRRTCA